MELWFARIQANHTHTHTHTQCNEIISVRLYLALKRAWVGIIIPGVLEYVAPVLKGDLRALHYPFQPVASARVLFVFFHQIGMMENSVGYLSIFEESWIRLAVCLRAPVTTFFNLLKQEGTHNPLAFPTPDFFQRFLCMAWHLQTSCSRKWGGSNKIFHFIYKILPTNTSCLPLYKSYIPH